MRKFFAAALQHHGERLAERAQLRLVPGAVFGPQALRHVNTMKCAMLRSSGGTRRGHLV